MRALGLASELFSFVLLATTSVSLCINFGELFGPCMEFQCMEFQQTIEPTLSFNAWSLVLHLLLTFELVV